MSKVMTTTGAIGFVTRKGTIKAVYCHADSYPAILGRLLVQEYSDIGSLHRLIDFGDVLYLDKRLPVTDVTTPQKGKTVSLGTRKYPELFEDSYEYLERMVEDGIRYIYLYSNGTWLVCDCPPGTVWDRDIPIFQDLKSAPELTIKPEDIRPGTLSVGKSLSFA